MSAGVVILLLVPPGEAQAPLIAGLAAATSRSLGAEARVVVDARTPASDDEAVGLADRLHANAVVTLRWLEGGRVSLHAHWSGQAGWTDRFFSFQEADALDERGRTIGFTLATMIRTESPLGPALETPPAAAAKAPAPPAPPAAPSWPRRPFELEASAQGHVAAHATAWGGGLRAAYFIAPRAGLTVGAAWYTGAMKDIDGRVDVASLSVGAKVPLVLAAPERPFELAVSAEAALSHEAVSRSGAAGSHTEGRWVPGARLRVTAAWFFTPHVTAFAGFGLQANFGETDIVVNGRTETTLSAYRGTGELGGRVRF
ncbi:hypothetical protein LZC95_23330 [Pendulispora brunnea]|uniref:Autotransporter outer membrane beta-barrel domain-containing protein n=1 Tax=Pendulispora brunnea TaxID=2905690 RepID=A0ABZ2KM44_9BACT